MKIVLIVLLLGLFVNLTSAFLWFNARTTEQPKRTTISSTTRRLTSRIQPAGIQQKSQLRNETNSLRQSPIAPKKNSLNDTSLRKMLYRLQNQVRNTTVAQRQADSINKKNNQTIPQTRFRAIAHQQQQQGRVLNNLSAIRQANGSLNNTNKKMANPRILLLALISKANTSVVNAGNRRVLLSTPVSRLMVADSKLKSSPVVNKTIQQLPNRLVTAKTTVTSTKTSRLQALTIKPVNNNVIQNRPRSLADYYYQEQLKAFYRLLNEQNARQNRLNNNSALRKRKREVQSNDMPVDDDDQMILTRAESSDVLE